MRHYNGRNTPHMTNTRTIRLLSIFLLLLCSSLSQAAERYITGIPIPLRAEPDSANRQILQLLPVGEKVKLGKSQKNNFQRVTTQSGIQGWIPNRYLSETSPIVSADSGTPGAPQKRVQYELEINRLNGIVSSMQQEKQIIESELQKLQEQVRRANIEVNTIRDVNASSIELENQNSLMRGALRTEKRKLAVLEQENVALQERKERDWFLLGALLVMVSLLSGFFLARVRSTPPRNSRTSL
ncbi:MAG: TIGR04211 family SH3 domain-containing protein [Gammaproteobacteria bacterium]|nr:TIGR04211 family SH3 domain-containing protein [Gammaproteobacteria bacterium]MBT3717626.1 TIGR04211 family SH3 domain-containing protein [Gammaproteobacteria bacterium]MBT3845819.1 TIGR04211 family SH3 domain-containing protein [Gammaproteobacteria bacterium]MBT3893887.1 TIGR04211 family SH3 domain-containing protein [Gammaproteobacteria bacterium]MBT4300408.1 TIGR04211 family SH3 domain-containing protein [Gammaproteobacteria bacterium]